MKLVLHPAHRKVLVLFFAISPVLLRLLPPGGGERRGLFYALFLLAVTATVLFATRRRWPMLLAGAGLGCWAVAALFGHSEIDAEGILREPLFPLIPMGLLLLLTCQLTALVLTLLPRRRKHA